MSFSDILIRFCMMKPRAGNIDSFYLKLRQSKLKGLMKIPCDHKWHTKYGSGSRSRHKMPRHVTKGHQKPFFGHAAHDLSSLLHVEFKNRSHLQSDPMQVNDRERSGQPRVAKVRPISVNGNDPYSVKIESTTK